MSDKQSLPAKMSVAGMEAELSKSPTLSQFRFSFSDAEVSVCQGTDVIWVVLSCPDKGGFAHRIAYSPGIPLQIISSRTTETHLDLALQGSTGTYHVALSIPDPATLLFRISVTFTPETDVLYEVPFRDLFPLDAEGSVNLSGGEVQAAQRGLNSGLLFLTMREPGFGSFLYFQNWTALNDYFLATETRPDGAVGGEWPELGYLPPVSTDKALRAGHEIVVSDAYLTWNSLLPGSRTEEASRFLNLLANVYRFLDKPRTEYHDWVTLAKQTIRDLERSPEATVRDGKYLYLHPYTDAEEPDSMVQLTTLLPMREFGRWIGEPLPLAEELRSGIRRFYDSKLMTIRRYLPTVGKQKNADEVDSWYLYHPLSNLARLAQEGDEEARELFLGSLDFAIKVAHHFKYRWPVQFNVETLEVIKGDRKESEPGQSDTGGLYAFVMLQAWKLTEQKRFLEEARAAIDGLADIGFLTAYQMNITAWGVNACLHLWRLTGEERYRDQSAVFLANFFHNNVMWESRLRGAASYSTFLGVTCLHDGPYMAMYECFESFAAFHEFLTLGQDDLPSSVRLLLTEYCKYALTRAWYFYPAHLPPQAVAKKVRNGHIDRKLAFPHEDLYADGQPAGQVGQEIYGCGASFTFVTRSYRRLRDAPFLLYCEYPLHKPEELAPRSFSLRLRGLEGYMARARIIPTSKSGLPEITMRLEEGSDPSLSGRMTEEGHLEFELPANMPIRLRWHEPYAGSTTDS